MVICSRYIPARQGEAPWNPETILKTCQTPYISIHGKSTSQEWHWFCSQSSTSCFGLGAMVQILKSSTLQLPLWFFTRWCGTETSKSSANNPSKTPQVMTQGRITIQNIEDDGNISTSWEASIKNAKPMSVCLWWVYHVFGSPLCTSFTDLRDFVHQIQKSNNKTNRPTKWQSLTRQKFRQKPAFRRITPVNAIAHVDSGKWWSLW